MSLSLSLLLVKILLYCSLIEYNFAKPGTMLMLVVFRIVHAGAPSSSVGVMREASGRMLSVLVA